MNQLKGGIKMSDCIFCKIIKGDLPSAKVYEDEDVFAFLDISPVTKGHTLVIPKVHNENIYDMEAESAAKLFAAVPKIARALKAEFAPKGMNLLNNNGAFAGQAVFHYHMHLIPRYDEQDGFGGKWNPRETNPEDLQRMASAVNSRL